MTFGDLYKSAGPQVITDCDNVAHGYGCMCLKGKNADGEVEDTVLWELEEALEEALEEEEMADGAVEDAQEAYDAAEDKVNRLQAAIKKHKEQKQ